jgi:hypothetical protein
MRGIAVLLTLVPVQVAAALPELLCQELRVALLDPVSLRTTEVKESRTLYRFAGGDLYLSNPQVKEYRYNKVVEQERRRFIAGHKTLLFDEELSRATFVHVYTDEVRVSHVSCNRVAR